VAQFISKRVRVCHKWKGARGKGVGSSRQMCGKCVGSGREVCEKCVERVGSAREVSGEAFFGSGWEYGIEPRCM